MLLIFADDLTGALDAAAPFAGRGLATEVAIGLDGVRAALADAPAVLSVNLGCRDGKADEARRRTQELLALVPAGTILFKKIDSRLKGHIAAEMDAISYRHALVAPAIPDFDRVVVDGAVFGFGVEIAIPVYDRLGGHAGRCTVPDTRSKGDIREALAAAQTEGADLLVGARGLAEALAEAMTGQTVPEAAAVPAGKGLFVIGSRDPITVEQIDVLGSVGPVSIVEAPNGIVPSHADEGAGLTLVQATQGAENLSPLAVSDRLAEGVVPHFTDRAARLLLSGGATAEAVLRAMGISRLRLAGECLPGLGVGWSGDQCIIAKSGGFGQADTLKRIAKMMLGDNDAGES
ncbi:four-carbon acid sugar kinase family protein [Agrobacterium radiobacter]|uniref:four-carbon acid sugar kinase family protein n=1 Tax=Agrobacterium radiobacter TaxID=362 RepID=UPI0007620B37|nr:MULTISPECIES: four-carbon acid sugar kinase family protein [Agrobacterium tumefaciens complex]KAB0461675.1 four-carbon acid sugar kinase family protein [Agrobacterium tumefaciens]KWT78121.1 Hrp-dependent type III effector protein [Agrobacterium radiobacter]NIB10764.1 four-carbon acid sugar kinase family protein [Agrobacterium radiobacter]OOO35612.1 Hrp-dependent type III effector protein [Agrobacterium radiobacter]